MIATANNFAVSMMERLARIIPTGDLGLTCDAVQRSDGLRMTIASSAKGGLVLSIGGEQRLQLELNLYLFISPNTGNVATERSRYVVRVAGDDRPMFSLDYERAARRNIPAAHYNFHFDHNDLVRELLDTGASRRGRLHRKRAERGKPAQLADLHFPVGGHRFRPCLEDVLEFLWTEFGIDVHKETARGAIAEGRREWRQLQLKAAVADDPETAAAELERLGYEVTRDDDSKTRIARTDRIEAI